MDYWLMMNLRRLQIHNCWTLEIREDRNKLGETQMKKDKQRGWEECVVFDSLHTAGTVSVCLPSYTRDRVSDNETRNIKQTKQKYRYKGQIENECE